MSSYLAMRNIQRTSRTFFTKVKEELDYIPARMIVLEYWQEKAVFTPATAEENDTDTTGRMVAAPRAPTG